VDAPKRAAAAPYFAHKFAANANHRIDAD